MENTVELLDHGYCRLIGVWGSDAGIIEAARMSTNKGFRGWGPFRKESAGGFIEVPGDEKLLRYLYEHKHSTPFEMAGLTIEVKAPIFVFRQWHRHRTQSYNEMSARYTPLPAEDYLPTVERLMAEGGRNKQAGSVSGVGGLAERSADNFREALKGHYKRSEDLYREALADGVPKELARIHLPVARYSSMRASANLRNWLAFLTLRLDAHAQYEIRVYAEAVGAFIHNAFPRTWELFAEGVDRG